MALNKGNLNTTFTAGETNINIERKVKPLVENAHSTVKVTTYNRRRSSVRPVLK